MTNNNEPLDGQDDDRVRHPEIGSQVRRPEIGSQVRRPEIGGRA